MTRVLKPKDRTQLQRGIGLLADEAGGLIEVTLVEDEEYFLPRFVFPDEAAVDAHAI